MENTAGFQNSIKFKMDMYSIGFIKSTDFPYRYKRYQFELWDDDILNSSFNHTIWSCEMNIKVFTNKEIDQLIQFLENLKKNTLGGKKEPESK